MKSTSLTLSALLFCSLTHAQSDAEVSKAVLAADSLFWQCYNTCNLSKIRPMLTDDVEFYHDQGGPTFGAVAMMKSFTNGLCKPGNDFSLRREAVPGTVMVFPLRKNDMLYGAIIGGSHYFYILKNKTEYRDGLARFIHLLLLQDGKWKMARILSFDHGPAPYENTRKTLELKKSELQAYAGKYQGPENALSISAGDGWLVLHTARAPMSLFPERQDVFFSKERDLTFTFTRDAQGKVTGMTVSEKGQEVEKLVKAP